MPRTLTQEIDRFHSMLKGLGLHAEQVASEYCKSLADLGKGLEDGLVQKGHNRCFLKALDQVGQGLAVPDVLFLAPDKRDLLISVDVRTQQEVIDRGINGRPLDEVDTDTARASILKAPKPIRRQYSSRSCRKRMPRSKKPTASELGVVVLETRLYTWQEIVDLLNNGVTSGMVPKKILTKLRKICERP